MFFTRPNSDLREKMKIILRLLIVLIITFSSVTAQGMDGNIWMKYKGENNIMDGFLDGFVKGYLAGKKEAVSSIKYQLSEGDLKLTEHPKYGYGYHLFQTDTVNLFVCCRWNYT